MTKTRISDHDVHTLEDLTNAISGLWVAHPSVIYFHPPLRFTLLAETLSDGSTVHNIVVNRID